jgi:hypothetical protein
MVVIAMAASFVIRKMLDAAKNAEQAVELEEAKS